MTGYKLFSGLERSDKNEINKAAAVHAPPALCSGAFKHLNEYMHLLRLERH
jgi:hypothetical protein